MNTRRHGWQRPLHPLQLVGMAAFSFLVAFFYCFLAPFLGSRAALITVITVFSSVVLSVMVLFIRCTAIDPSDKIRYHNRKKKKAKAKVSFKSRLNYGFILGQILLRTFRRIERKILKTCIKRKYLLDPRKTHVQLEPLLPFPLVFIEDTVSSDPSPDDISFCSLCNYEIKKRSKHCRTCNRCVEGFDHHCRWLNNCVGKKNYTTFILLMLFTLLMLLIEGGTAIAIFIRCFVDKVGIQREIAQTFHTKFPRGLLAAISVMLVLISAYGSAALGQLFFFHLVLIRKGMRTYDYILAMREQNQFSELDSLSDTDFSSDDSSEPDTPERSIVVSRFVCDRQRTDQSPGQITVNIDPESETSLVKPKQGFRATVDPWKLIRLNSGKALIAAEKARERLAKQHQMAGHESINPLPFEMKSGPVQKPEGELSCKGVSSIPLVTIEKSPSSPGRFSSPRRRLSGSKASLSNLVALPNQKYRSNFDLKLTEVSRELEGYISRQVLCTVVKDGTEASPR